jgi:cytochrome bd-type quinol oxidase subunit 1
MASPTAIVAYIALFVLTGFLFLFANLVIGWLVRPRLPNTEKLEVYECGEPTIGSSFVQFDLRFYVVAVLFALAANECGWVATEVGRQPWIVYPTLEDGKLVGGLRTTEGLSEAVKAHQVLSSIIMFGLVYMLLFVLWIFLLNKKIQEGPEAMTDASKVPHEVSESSILDAASRRGVIRDDSADS